MATGSRLSHSPAAALLLLALLGLQALADGFTIQGCVDRPQGRRKRGLLVYCYDKDYSSRYSSSEDGPGRVRRERLPPESQQEGMDGGDGSSTDDNTRTFGPPSARTPGGRDQCEDDRRPGDDLIGYGRTNRNGCYKITYYMQLWDSRGPRCQGRERWPDIYCVALQHKTRTYKNWNPSNVLTMDPFVVP